MTDDHPPDTGETPDLDNDSQFPRSVVRKVPLPPEKAIPLRQWEELLEEHKNIVPLKRPFETLRTSVPIGPKTFVLFIERDDMEPEFPVGCLIIVEPEHVAVTGDYVVARHPVQRQVVLRQLVDLGDAQLQPLNPRYPTVALAGWEIIGVVRGFNQWSLECFCGCTTASGSSG